MKKTLTLILSAVLILSMLCCLCSCGESAKKQEAIDAHNATAEAFNDITGLINDNVDALPEAVITTFQSMSDLLNQYTDLLNGSTLSDEKYDEMIAWFTSVQDWIKTSKVEINAILTSAEY